MTLFLCLFRFNRQVLKKSLTKHLFKRKKRRDELIKKSWHQLKKSFSGFMDMVTLQIVTTFKIADTNKVTCNNKESQILN